jgi:type II secretory pathway pseudopilin PulG
MIKRRGYTLVELLVYIALFSVVSIVVILSVGKLVQVYGRVRIERRVSLAAETAMERIAREVRTARFLDTATGSTLVVRACTDPSDAACASSVVRTFALASNAISFTDSINGTFTLTPADVRVTQLSFVADPMVSGVRSRAVHITMKIESGTSNYLVQRSFQSFVILRGSY